MTYDWIPPLIMFSEYENNWKLYVQALYQCFENDFIKSTPRFRGRPLALKRHPIINDKEATFWHMISQGEDEQERTPDFRRCERIRWPRPIIDHAVEPTVKIWENVRRRNEKRICLWLEPYDYLVVLAERRGYLLFWTAYPIDSKHAKLKLEREYRAYKAKAAR